MSKSAMLRTRRRDVNVKPNRRLDRKSSRGMIYENEELRLRTININAEIERGQSDIKKLRKENEQLRKEIWCLRDEYDKLDRLLKEKQDCSSSSDSETCTSCSESEDPETTQNLENVQKTTLNSLRNDFDHLSVVTEETSEENSVVPSKDANWEVLAPDMGYPSFGSPKMISTTQNLHLNGSRTLLPPPTPIPTVEGSDAPGVGFIYGGYSSTLPLPSPSTPGSPQCPKHFFSPLKSSKSQVLTTFTCAPLTVPGVPFPQVTFPPLGSAPSVVYNNLIPIQKSAPDILVQSNLEDTSTNSFVNGGTLDELLQDIDNISQDILKISSHPSGSQGSQGNQGNQGSQGPQGPLAPLVPLDVPGAPVPQGFSEIPDDQDKGSLGRPYKSEISVVLMPKPMPLLGFDKYHNIQSSLDSLDTLKQSKESILQSPDEVPKEGCNSFTPDFPVKFPQESDPQKTNPFFFGTLKTETTEKDLPTPIVEVQEVPQTPEVPTTPGADRNKRTRKLSIYFKGKKDQPPKADAKDSDNQKSSDSKTSYDKKHRKSSSTSPERRHVHIQDKNKKHHKKRRKGLHRRSSTSAEKYRDQRSFSVCTDRSNILLGFDDLHTNSERDRSNSLSSCDTVKSRKTSHIPPLAVGGKIPWFGCWGNGCL